MRSGDSPPAAGALIPHPWAPGEEGPGRWRLPEGEEPPLLVLIDRSRPEVAEGCGALVQLLSAAERQRLERLPRADDRQRFLLGRAVVRGMLGLWLGRDPATLTIREGPRGKPELAAEPMEPANVHPRFNLSHSGDLVLLGFHRSRGVGVDVERARPVPDWRRIALRHLPTDETTCLEALPAVRRPAAFLEAWCRLEARLKARGLGLAGAGRRPPGEWETDGSELWPVTVRQGYAAAAALAWEGSESAAQGPSAGGGGSSSR